MVEKCESQGGVGLRGFIEITKGSSSLQSAVKGSF